MLLLDQPTEEAAYLESGDLSRTTVEQQDLSCWIDGQGTEP
jgi:hypothetical protein